MTSQRKIEANRRNAKLSTGPKTARGKAFSGKNAIKHGLAAAALDSVEDPHQKELMEALALTAQSPHQQLDHAATIAEATRELVQMQQVRTQLLESLVKENFSSVKLLKIIAGVERYERRAQSRRRTAAKRLLKRQLEDPDSSPAS